MNCLRFCLGAALLLSVLACSGRRTVTLTSTMHTTDSRALDTPLKMMSSGLRVHHLQYPRRSGGLAPMLEAAGVAHVLAEEDARRLAASGLGMVRIGEGDLDRLLQSLGQPATHIDAWYGQTYDWREVHSVRDTRSSWAIASSGRVYRLTSGKLVLQLRSWTVMMEDGPHMSLEVLPVFDRSRSNRLTSLIGQEPFVGERFTDALCALEIDVGYAYIVFPVEGGTPVTGTPDRVVNGSRLPAVGTGLEAGSVMLLGEALLGMTRNPPLQEILVFVPRIPDILFPPGRPLELDSS